MNPKIRFECACGVKHEIEPTDIYRCEYCGAVTTLPMHNLREAKTQDTLKEEVFKISKRKQEDKEKKLRL